MELQLGFDDDDYLAIDTKRKPEGDLHVPYHVKLCVPAWFEDESHESLVRDSGTTDELQLFLKFSADFNYQQKEFAKAARQYEAVFDIIPENNLSLKQDVKESWCRSLMYSGKQDESLQMSKKIVEESLLEDIPHQRQALILHSAMCEFAGYWQGCVEAFEKLCCFQPYYEKFWIRLGHAYLKLLTPHTEEKDSSNICSEEEYLVLALTSFLKAQILLHHSIFRASDIMKHRNRELLKQTKETIAKLPMPTKQKEFAHKWLKGKCAPESDSEIEEEVESQGVITDSTNVYSNSRLFFNSHCSWVSQYKNEFS